MRAREFINQDLDEGWKEKAIGGLALGAGLAGAFGPGVARHMTKHDADKPRATVTRHHIQRSPEVDKRIDFKNNEPEAATAQQHDEPEQKSEPIIKFSKSVPSIKLPAPKKFDPATLRSSLEKAAAQHGIKGKELAMLMARVGTETAGFTSLEELGPKGKEVEYFFNRYDKNGDNPDKAAILGNTQELDGVNYRGGGHIHITGRYNYKMVQDELNRWHKYKKNPINLVDNPDVLRTNPSVAADASIAFWKLRVAPELKGKHANIKTATKMVNPAGRGALDTIQRFAKELVHYKTPPKKHATPKHK